MFSLLYSSAPLLSIVLYYPAPLLFTLLHSLSTARTPSYMAAALVESRKRSATPFLDEPIGPPPHLSKRTRCSTDAAAAAVSFQQPFVFDPIDALHLVFPDADRRVLQECFETSGRCVNAAVSAFRDLRAREAVSAEIACAAQADRMDDCAQIFVSQMAAASDTADAKNRATWLLDLFKQSLAARASSGAAESLREENSGLKGQVEALIRDNAVLKRAVAIQHIRQKDHEEKAQELEQLNAAVSEYRQKIAALEMKNYALSVHLKGAESSMAGKLYRPHPDVF